MKLSKKQSIKIYCVCLTLILGNLFFIPFGLETVTAGIFNQSSYSEFSNGETIFTDISTNPGSIQLMQEPDLVWTSIGNDTTSAYFGRSIACAGDVNNDGYDDVIVGANNDLGNALTRQGKAYLFLGSAQGLENEPSWNATGNNEATSNFGWSVAGIGDVNGDGYDDVIVGANKEDVTIKSVTYTDCGAAFIYLGCPSGLEDSYWSYFYTLTNNAQFGHCVAGAGDINNDGYDDFIISTGYIDTNPYTNNGQAWLYLGASSPGLISNPWTFSANQNYSYYGRSITGAGDVNGDGYDDWLVGASGMDSGGTKSVGVAYLYLGSSTPFSTTSSWSSSGDKQAYSEFGISVSCAGDVNADGYDDWLVGQSSYASSISHIVGKAYLYLGSSSVNSTECSWSSIGENKTYSKYGYSVSGIGDLNGDGYGDWIVGCPDYSSINSNCGKIYLYTGSNFGFSSTAVWTSIGDNQGNAHFGWSVAGAGDVNDDGIPDFVIGAYGYDETGINAGKAYLYMNHESLAQTVPIWECVGEDAAGAHFGYSVACAGDINADGYDDWLVGAGRYNTVNTWAGKAYLYLGSSSGLSKTAAWSSLGTNQAYASYGATVAGAGDVNGDGFDDWLVGEPYVDISTRNDAGKVYLYLGRATSISTITSSWSGSGINTDSFYGRSIDGLGDINSDGYDDWIIGEPGYNGTGCAKIYLGASSVTITKVAVKLDPAATGDNYGFSVAGLGDVNGDGFDDWLIGAPNEHSSASSDCGAAYLYFGKSNMSSTFYDEWNSYGDDQEYASFGYTVAGAGDVNNDGYADWLVAAREFDAPPMNKKEGKVYLYLGKPVVDEFDPSPAWTSTGDSYTGGYFGNKLAGVGDVNGDGFDDWLVGTIYIGAPSNYVGKAYLYCGGSFLSSEPVWSSQGEYQEYGFFGVSVSGGGDVNGDGYDEWLVGASSYNTANLAAGKVYIYQARGYCQYGEFISSVCDGEYYQPDVWQSLEWFPKLQEEGIEVKFQIATNDDGTTWEFIGPDGTSETYYTNANAQNLFTGHTGRYLRYKIYLEAEPNVEERVLKSPVIDEVTIHYGTYEEPTVTVLSPNGGEDWMKLSYYPITWEATGTLGDNPIIISYTLDNGDNWTIITSNEPNDGLYNWTVPNQETPNAFIKVVVTDIYDHMVSDTSDASFAIDPPPPDAGDAPAGGGGTQFPDDEDSGTSESDISKTKAEDDDWPWLVPISIVLVVIVVISICLNFYLIENRRSLKEKQSVKNEKQIARINEILKNKRR